MIDALPADFPLAPGQLDELSQLPRPPEIPRGHVLDPGGHQGMTVGLRAPDDPEPGAILGEGVVGEQVRCTVVTVPDPQVEEVAPGKRQVGRLLVDGGERVGG